MQRYNEERVEKPSTTLRNTILFLLVASIAVAVVSAALYKKTADTGRVSVLDTEFGSRKDVLYVMVGAIGVAVLMVIALILRKKAQWRVTASESFQ